MANSLQMRCERLQQAAAYAQSISDVYHATTGGQLDDIRRVSLRSSGTPKLVPLLIYEDGALLSEPEPTWDAVYWIDRYEDMYNLPRTGRVLVVHRPAFRTAPAA